MHETEQQGVPETDPQTDQELVFALSGDEFGETYHIVAAYLCDPRVRVKLLSNVSPGQKQFVRHYGVPTASDDHHVVQDYSLLTELLRRAGQHAKDTVQRRFLERCQTNDTRSPVGDYVGRELGQYRLDTRNKVLVWIRQRADHENYRNMTPTNLARLCNIVQACGLYPVIVGCFRRKRDNRDPVLGHLSDNWILKGVFQDPLFNHTHEPEAIFNQLELLHLLHSECSVVASIGYQSGGMDGGTFIGIPTITINFAERDDQLPPALACPRLDPLSKRFSDAFILVILLDVNSGQDDQRWNLTYKHVAEIMECFSRIKNT